MGNIYTVGPNEALVVSGKSEILLDLVGFNRFFSLYTNWTLALERWTWLKPSCPFCCRKKTLFLFEDSTIRLQTTCQSLLLVRIRFMVKIGFRKSSEIAALINVLEFDPNQRISLVRRK